MNFDRLNSESKQDLAARARRLGIAGHQTMRKEDLIKAITRAIKKKELEKDKGKEKEKAAPEKSADKAKAKVAPTAATVPTASAKSKPGVNGKHTPVKSEPSPAKVQKPAVIVPPPVRPMKPVSAVAVPPKAKVPELPPKPPKPEPPKPIVDANGKPPRALQGGHQKDRIIVVVRDPYWLHAVWELTHQSVQRAEYALGQDWHGARPILRICDVSAHDTTSTAEAIVRDIDIHGGCNNWYLEITQPPKSYRVDIGYVSRRGQFYVLARSNVVTAPKAGSSDAIDENWADIDVKQADRLYAMSSGFDNSAGDTQVLREFFEERLRRPMSSPALAGAPQAPPPPKDRKFFFSVDAEMIVYGRTVAGARVTIQGEPVKLRPDGSFTMRYSFPDGRQILPAIAESIDGAEERKIVLAVERNTKELEPLIHDQGNGD